MRIWDLPPNILCRQHLLGEHRELHAIWTVLAGEKTGYASHPETLRWKGNNRHEALVTEMCNRGYNHRSPLDEVDARGESKQSEYVDTPERQLELLREEGCDCRVGKVTNLILPE